MLPDPRIAAPLSGHPRFTTRRPLGAGAFGTVYEVYDREREAAVALKLLRDGGGERLYRFKQEFRALAGLVHPNLVTLYELLHEGDRWLLTMELLVGRDFLHHVTSRSHGAPEPESASQEARGEVTSAATASLTSDGAPQGSPAAPMPGPPADPRVLADALAQLALGLDFLHLAGKLHRDLKPSNVLVTDEGRLVILDFGIVADAVDSAGARGPPLGTPIYMSPEQARGEALARASDWYSVGVMLYEALAGRPPLVGSAAEVLEQRRRPTLPPRPSRLRPDVPAALESLCLDLLRPQPEERPDGAEVRARLREMGAGPPAPATSRPRTAPFVGRRVELESLARALARASAGHPQTVLVRGTSGQGKTRLVHEFLSEVRRDPSALVLAGRCYEHEAVPFKVLDGVVDALGRHLGARTPAELDDLTVPDAWALGRVFPALARLAARSPVRAATDVQTQQLAFTALRTLLGRLAARHTLVLFVDDLQWGDLDGVALLGELLRPGLAPPLLFLGCYRAEEAETSPVVRTLRALLLDPRRPAPIELALGGLAEEEATALARALLPASRERDGAVTAVVREGGGSPFFVTELARLPDRVGSDVGALVETRAASLPPAAQRLLRTVALAGEPLPRSLARRSAEVIDADAPEPQMLALLVAERLLRSRAADLEEELEPYHDRVREAVVARLDAGARVALHTRLAEVLEASGRARPEQLAWHFSQAGQRARSARHTLDAAERAYRGLAFDRAARLFGEALELAPPGQAEASRLRVRQAEALVACNRAQEAARCLLRAAEGAAEDGLPLRLRAAELLLREDLTGEGREVLGGVLRAVGVSMPRTGLGALLSFAWLRLRIALWGLEFRERPPDAVPPRELVRLDACWAIAQGLAVQAPFEAGTLHARHLLLALRAGEPGRVARAFALEAYIRSNISRHDRHAAPLVARASDLAARAGDSVAMALCDIVASFLASHRWEWRRAGELARQAHRHLVEGAATAGWERDLARALIATSHTLQGDFRVLAEEVPVWVDEAGTAMARTFLENILVGIHAAGDRVAEAEAVLRRMVVKKQERWSEAEGSFMAGDMALTIYARPEVFAERYAREWGPRIRRVWRSLLRHNLPRFLDFEARALLMRAGDLERRRLRSIVRSLLAFGLPGASGLGLAIDAALAEHEGRRDVGLALLARAEESFLASDMRLHAAAARFRRGQRRGGADGSRVRAEAEAEIRMRGIVAPEPFIRVMVP